jgi:hypothetical protein
MVTFGYLRGTILVTSGLLAAVIVMVIAAAVFTQSAWLRMFMVSCVGYFSAVCAKQLLRLNERIVITQRAITLSSPRNTTTIPWVDIIRINRQTSLLERERLTIQSSGGLRITAGEPLLGYYELVDIVNQRVGWPPKDEGSRDETVEIAVDKIGTNGQCATSSEGGVVHRHRCAECGSTQLTPLKGWLRTLYVACESCGHVQRAVTQMRRGSWIYLASRAWLIASCALWSLILSVVGVACLMLLVMVGYLVVWAGWNFVVAPIGGLPRFKFLELRNFGLWWIPSFFVSSGLLVLFVRYSPERLLPSFLRDSPVRRKK